jgi:crossover junction endodeoxyribonuclease RusA
MATQTIRKISRKSSQLRTRVTASMAEEYPSAKLIVITGEPLAKGRPRFGNGHVYTPQETREYEELIGWMTQRLRFPRGPLSLRVVFYYGKRQGDIDNRVKTLLDGLQRGGALLNDNQIVEVHAQLQKDALRPRVEFTVSPFDDRGP